MSERRVIPVSRLVSYVRSSLEGDPVLTGVLVEGEISNLRQPYSGHWYFSLKDQNASLSCVMFASSNRNVRFPVKNGVKVVVRGNVSVYPAQGTLQLVVNAMKESGVGDLYRQLELLKQKLAAEGLFDERHKKPLPLYPMNIALVTGNNTAAREDVLITFAKRWPAAKVYEYPCPVQGADAPPKIIDALKKADLGNHQLILLVRGGGSIEDLWCFNDEALARVIYDLKTPVVTGIGHEIDFTIADFAADVRANTPTGAVEISTPDIAEVHQALHNRLIRMEAVVKRRLSMARVRYEKSASHPVMVYPERLSSDSVMRLDYLRERLMKGAARVEKSRSSFNELANRFTHDMNTYSKNLHAQIMEIRMKLYHDTKNQMSESEHRLNLMNDAMKRAVRVRSDQERMNVMKSSALLDAYSPLKILSRGYSIVTKDDEAVRSVDMVHADDLIDIRVYDGTIRAKACETEKKQ